jgi:AcrR family transcriptional regulator
MVQNEFAVPTPAFADALAGADPVVTRPTPAAAFQRAREHVREGSRLDMVALARELGIARATLYRWTGDRDRLLADACWAEVDSLLAYFDHTTPGTGLQRLERLAGDFLEALAGNDGLQALLAHEGEHGLRLITALDGGVRPRIVAAVGDVIERETARGYRPPADPVLLADGIVSMGERFLYHGGNPELNPDPATARLVIGLLLREPGRGRQSQTGSSPSVPSMS